MPGAELQPDYVPKIRLDFWGRCIRTQRVNQRLKAKDFCRDLGVSEATLRRVEKGDPMVSVISYMRAMGRLGILTRLVPEPPEDLWRVEDGRVGYCYRPRDVPYCKVRRVRDSSPD
jgi:transcriptional regulator with XRE-family HTH domain